VAGMLNRSGRAVQRDGQAVADQADARSIVSGVLAGMLEQRVPLLRAWGVLEG
jgi:hypothetical protein